MAAAMVGDIARTSDEALKVIPGGNGWPIVGHTVELLKDYRGLLTRMHAAYGPVHKLRVLGDARVSLLGPEANELVLMDRDKIFSNRLGWRSLETLLSGALMLRDFEEHKAHKKVMAPAFTIPTLTDYLQDIQPILNARLDAWRAAPPPLFFPAVKELLLEMSMRVFLGERNASDIQKIKAAFMSVVSATVSLVRAPIPGLAYKKGLDGRRMLLEFIKSRINVRRDGQGRDIFTRLCQATDDHGEHWTDDEIAKHMLFLMGAAHDTTTSAICTLIWSLVAYPDWQVRLREECVSLNLGPDRMLAYDDLSKMPECEYSFKEALRMYPPVVSINRCSLKAFSFKGFTIPANTMIALSPAFTHMMPEIWSEPQIFDPMRFSPGRAEDLKHRFSWIPFGGGAHQCIGMNFAYIQAKSFVSHLLPRFELALPPDYKADIAMLPIPRHKDGLPLTFRPLAA